MGTWFPKHVVEKSNMEVKKENRLHKTVVLLNSFLMEKLCNMTQLKYYIVSINMLKRVMPTQQFRWEGTFQHVL
jgi:hypothetical protein